MDINEVNYTEDVDEEQQKSGETKAEKFMRLAPPRVNKVISGLQSLAKLSSHGSYEYTEDQVQKMFDAIKTELATCEAAFKPKEEKKNSGFTF